MSSTILFRDDFEGRNRVDSANWRLPTSSPANLPSTFLGRTQFRLGTFGTSISELPDTLPNIINGRARLRLDTLNPVLLDVPNNPLNPNSANPSFFGTDLIINRDFTLGNGLAFEAQVRIDAPRGLVASLFSFFDEGLDTPSIPPGQNIDEIDFEFLTNYLNNARQGSSTKVLTNVYDDDPLGPGSGITVDNNGLDLTRFNTFRIEWRRNSVRWFINGIEILTRTDIVPDEAQTIRLNFWAPGQAFSQAFDASLQPVSRRTGDTNRTLLSRNQTFFYEIDSVQVERLMPVSSNIIVGSRGHDRLTGTSTNNRIFGLGGNDRLLGLSGNDLIRGDAGADQMNGGAGIDTLEYGNSNARVIVNLSNNSARGGHAQGDIITNFERIHGSRFNDILIGSAGNNVLLGGGSNDRLLGLSGNDLIRGDAGADQMNGGAGIDILEYGNSNARVIVNLSNNSARGGHAQGDIIANFERIHGSRFNDILIGSAGNNVLLGRGSNDQLLGLSGNDLIRGDAGNDLIRGDAGADQMNGGAGIDTLEYGNSNARVIVNLSNNSARGGHAQGDIIANFERIHGSRFNDILIGNAGNNVLLGGGSNDQLLGLSGNDLIRGDAGADQMNGGAGIDTLEYGNSNARVIVNLSNNSARGGHAQGDIITNFERIHGSRFNDILIGSAGNNVLLGLGGNDRLLGLSGNDLIRGDAGADQMNGGAGIDTLEYGNSNARVIVNLSNNSARGGHAQGDIIANFERIHGSRFNDILIGNAGNNVLLGGGSNDQLLGLSGNDLIRGDAGNDTVTGGNGNDIFQFLNPNLGTDIITDFTINQDIIQVSASGFGGELIANTTIINEQFVLGTSARNASDRFIYDRSSGILKFDIDGSGATAAIQIATLTNRTALNNTAIRVIA
ncbi:Ca2+-binding protein, RTX toxin [Leptolyngbya sp. PCC 7375]|nr:Ca2+-binding protein, RTX toxin [Leptolyngbya sp. PCC 7375]